uniref:Uncharacterized protein n=1 Tax=Anopheles culicifacies TaxID=139723 RepID=A0A182MLZ1_9DIPT
MQCIFLSLVAPETGPGIVALLAIYLAACCSFQLGYLYLLLRHGLRGWLRKLFKIQQNFIHRYRRVAPYVRNGFEPGLWCPAFGRVYGQLMDFLCMRPSVRDFDAIPCVRLTLVKQPGVRYLIMSY